MDARLDRVDSGHIEASTLRRGGKTFHENWRRPVIRGHHELYGCASVFQVPMRVLAVEESNIFVNGDHVVGSVKATPA